MVCKARQVTEQATMYRQEFSRQEILMAEKWEDTLEDIY